ncbi:MAG: glycosyltransferase family 2 protein, partial [Anaerolineae bacterium]|nr:glycosyltransferase family 2 protein [Anaerolineae bacterium]
NWFAAKYLEFMFNTVALTDVGCTMRLLHRSDLNRITPHFTVGTSHFGLEMMLLVIQSRARFIEIPLNYKERVGQSMVTGSFRKTLVLGLQMLFFITWSRLRAAAGRGPVFAEQR